MQLAFLYWNVPQHPGKATVFLHEVAGVGLLKAGEPEVFDTLEGAIKTYCEALGFAYLPADKDSPANLIGLFF